MKDRPFLLALGGIAMLCIMDALIKAAGARYPTFQLTFLRFFAGFLWTASAVAILRPSFPSREAIRSNALRGVIVLVTATSFFYGLQTLPLAEAIAFSFLSPLFLALFGSLILKEVLGRSTLAGLGIGFMGMLVMTFAQGLGSGSGLVGGSLHLPGVAAAILSAITYALGLVLLRQRAQQDALILIVLFQTMVPCALLGLPALFVWQPVQGQDWLLFAAIGGLGLAGQLLMAQAFKRAEAAFLAPAEYSALVFAVLLGFVFFAEVPGLATFAGSGLVILGTLVAMRGR